MSLKEITKDLHTAAESCTFTQRLIKGTVTPEEYKSYLYNLLPIYSTIEWYCNRLGVFDDMPTLPRLRGLKQDFDQLDTGEYVCLTPSTREYVAYLHELGNDPERMHLMRAHLYCRHMGDLFGGQVIKKRVPFSSGKFYEFEDAEALKVKLRSTLDDSLGEEARVAFVWAIRLMEELGNE